MKKECCPDIESHGPLCAWSQCFRDRDRALDNLHILMSAVERGLEENQASDIKDVLAAALTRINEENSLKRAIIILRKHQANLNDEDLKFLMTISNGSN